jgi:hypothetical protein
LSPPNTIRRPCKAQLIAAKGENRNRDQITTSLDILVFARFRTGKSLFRLGALALSGMGGAAQDGPGRASGDDDRDRLAIKGQPISDNN